MGLQHPRLIGFGISNRQTFDQACQYAQGAIIGSAFIDLLSTSQQPEQDIVAFIHSLKGEIHS
jgi:tryptophan synthase alpha chain